MSRLRRRSPYVVPVLFLASSLPTAQRALPARPHFTRVADTATPVPGGNGSFSLFVDARDLDGDTVVFDGYDASSRQGLYAFRDGQLQRLVDQNTLVPGSTTQHFAIFFDVAVSDGWAFFTAGWSGGTASGCAFSPNEGLFTLPLGTTTPMTLADSNNTPYSCFQGVDVEDGTVVVTGGNTAVDVFHNHQESVLLWLGPQSLTPLVDTTDTIPGTGVPFTGFDQRIFWRDGRLVFGNIVANSVPPLQGAYLHDGTLHVLADGQTSVPGGSGTFQDLRGLNFDGQRGAFRGVDASGATALWIGSGPGNLHAAVDRFTQVPGTAFSFLGFANPVAFEKGTLVFNGYWAGGGSGLFQWRGGRVSTLVARGDALDGRIVNDAFALQGHVSRGRILVRVSFQGGASGLYLAPLPERL